MLEAVKLTQGEIQSSDLEEKDMLCYVQGIGSFYQSKFI